MRLVWATDVHLNFLSEEPARRFCDELRAQSPDVVLFSGDIAEADSVAGWLAFVAAEVGRPVWYVLGNHDYYGGGIEEVRAQVQALSARDTRLQWLPGREPIELQPGVMLVGQDGWGDGRL